MVPAQQWKKEQEKRKKGKGRKVIFYWLLGVIFLIIGGLVVKSWQILQSSKWDGKSSVNFVVDGKEVRIVSFNPQNQEALVFIIPSGTQIEVVHGYGKYRAEKITGLENQEERDDLFMASFQETLGIPLDGEVKLARAKREERSEKGKEGREEADSGKKILSSEIREVLLGRRETDFSQLDLIRLWWGIRGLRFDQTKSIELSEAGAFSTSPLADQTPVWEIDKDRLDRFFQKYFSKSEIVEDNLLVEILNGTSHPGLAEKAARLINNIGGQVVWIGNSESQIPNCKLQASKEKKNSYTAQKLMKIFNCTHEEKKGGSRADITLVLGEDYWQKLNQK